MAAFDGIRKDVLKRAEDAGVSVVNCSLRASEWEKVHPLAKDFDNLHFTIGSCPYRPEFYNEQKKLMEKHAKDIVGIGEIGLDYYWEKTTEGRNSQEKDFRGLLELASELKKPVLIHSRNAEKQSLAILEEMGVKKAIMHCYSGDIMYAKKAIELGYLISIPTNIVSSKQKQGFAKDLPLESIVLETDAPYLSPDPKNTINEPKNVLGSAKEIAKIRGIDVEEVARQTTKNAKAFFGI